MYHEIQLPRTSLTFEVENSGQTLGMQRAPPFLRQGQQGARLCKHGIGAPVTASGQPGWLWSRGEPPRELRAAPRAAEKAERSARKHGPTTSIPRNRFALEFCTRSSGARKKRCVCYGGRYENKDEDTNFGFSEDVLWQNWNYMVSGRSAISLASCGVPWCNG